jgi:hypothetical protein
MHPPPFVQPDLGGRGVIAPEFEAVFEIQQRHSEKAPVDRDRLLAVVLVPDPANPRGGRTIRRDLEKLCGRKRAAVVHHSDQESRRRLV